MNISIKNSGSNYLARVIKLPEPRRHSNADRLLCVNVLNNNVITGQSAKANDLYIFFPLECAINHEYLSFSNSFSDPELNADKKTKGFFASSGRVKCLKLRGEKSEGYIVPIKDINLWLQEEVITEKDVDQDFDSIGDTLLCWKYVNKQEEINESKANRENKKGKKAKENRIVEGQFAFHRNTSHLGREVYNINPDDLVSWTEKLHGSSGIASKVLCKRKLSFIEKILKNIFNVKVQDTHYDYLWASRTVIKNSNIVNKVHYYDTDIWKIAFDKVQHALKDGITLYFEIVGHTPSGAFIQKRYDYGCDPGTLDIYLYRVTYTSSSGDVYEFSWPQIKDYCVLYGLKHVPEHFYGKAKDMFPELSLDEHWRMNFLQKLSDKYLEKECYLCKNKVPNEGGVLRKESGSYKPYKHKSFKFKELESKQMDTGEVNIEDIS